MPEENLEGHPLRQPGYHGKVVVLIYWGTSCIPCREEVRAVERPYQTLEALGLVVLTVNSQEKHEVVRGFVQDVTVTFPIVLDLKGGIDPAFPIRGLPATYVLDRNQIIVGRALGPREEGSKEGHAYFGALLGEAL